MIGVYWKERVVGDDVKEVILGLYCVSYWKDVDWNGGSLILRLLNIYISIMFIYCI